MYTLALCARFSRFQSSSSHHARCKLLLVCLCFQWRFNPHPIVKLDVSQTDPPFPKSDVVSILIQLLNWMKSLGCGDIHQRFNPHPIVRLDVNGQLRAQPRSTCFNPHPIIRLNVRPYLEQKINPACSFQSSSNCKLDVM